VPAPKSVLAVATFLVLAAIAEATPRLGRFRILRPQSHAATSVAPPPSAASSTIGETEIERTLESHPDLAQPEELGPLVPRDHGPIASSPDAPGAPGIDLGGSPVDIVDEHHSLDRLFRILELAEKGAPGSVARIVFFGDSVVASDFGTGTLRRLLQRRFGDAGHGFVLAASAWPQYFHNDVYRFADKGFRVSRIVGPRAEDGLYGLGGVSFSGPPGLRSRFGTAKTGSYGRRVSKFQIAYLAQPGGGLIHLNVDGKTRETVDTEAPEKQARFAEVNVPDGEHELELLTARGTTRLFGVVLERDGPGVVLDAIGLVGARIRTLDESNDANFAEALAWRRPNLVTFQFGANESGDGFAYPMPQYHATMRALIEKVQAAVPAAGCLVIGAMDRARKEDGHLATVPVIPLIVAEQRKVAAEIGCAFYSAFDAMGGKGSMATWVRKGFGAGDYTHPTSWGAEQLGRWIDAALMERYAEYRRRASTPTPNAGH
jgi:lysophospholipase L1-like esterase